VPVATLFVLDQFFRAQKFASLHHRNSFAVSLLVPVRHTRPSHHELLWKSTCGRIDDRSLCLVDFDLRRQARWGSGFSIGIGRGCKEAVGRGWPPFDKSLLPSLTSPHSQEYSSPTSRGTCACSFPLSLFPALRWGSSAPHPGFWYWTQAEIETERKRLPQRPSSRDLRESGFGWLYFLSPQCIERAFRRS